MDTPVYDFINEYVSKNPVRLHMPGHKGSHVSDITEIDGADFLMSPEGIIARSEENAGRLFGAHTFYSTEGSSLCIRAMLFLIKKKAEFFGRRPYILAGRNVHSSFLYAATVLDIDVDFIMQHEQDSYECCRISGTDIEVALKSCEKNRKNGADNNRIPDALYVTSPDYLGNMLDIREIADYCHRYGVTLLVDNAHGSYLKFLKTSRHPIDLGADMCCDSAHKTLPVLTGGAYLHISENTDAFFKNFAKQAMSVFATTSPSYLVLQSLDVCNSYLEGNESIRKTAGRIEKLKKKLSGLGYGIIGNEPLKITIGFEVESERQPGNALADFLKSRDIYVEYHDPAHVVMMFSTENSPEDLCIVEKAFEEAGSCFAFEKKKTVMETGGGNADRKKRPERGMSFHDALFADSEQIDVKESIGRILAEPLVHCPPCVPVYMLGEIIGEDILRFHSGKIRVVK